jgi:hypothetical protein
VFTRLENWVLLYQFYPLQDLRTITKFRHCERSVNGAKQSQNPILGSQCVSPTLVLLFVVRLLFSVDNAEYRHYCCKQIIEEIKTRRQQAFLGRRSDENLHWHYII